MRKIPVLLSLILVLLPAIPSAAEDRVELVKGSKGSKELVYRNDILTAERSYDESGGLTEERSIGADSLPIETDSYSRENGRLVRVQARDASGAAVGSRTYHYDRDGRLLSVVADGILGIGAAGMVSSGGTPQSSWTEAETATIVLDYDKSGRAILIQAMKEGKAVSLERRTYGVEGSLSSVVTEDKASGTSSEITFDDKGRPLLRMDVPTKGAEAKTQFRYDASGRLLEELKRVGVSIISTKRTYAEDGSLSRIETRRDGELLLIVEYTEKGRVEELYSDGTIFVKATYVGGRKIKDEFYSDGAIVRSRDYQ